MPAKLREERDASASQGSSAPYFDREMRCWVVTRHEDMLAIFREPSLIPGKAANGGDGAAHERSRLQMRAETMEALSAPEINAWRYALTAEAGEWLTTLPSGQPVDLLGAYARPLGLSLAARVTRVSRQTAQGFSDKARLVSAAAADPENLALKAEAQQAEAELAMQFASNPAALRDSTFVALSQTLPCILGNAWLALVEHPVQWRLLHQQPALLEQAMEELLRYAGLVRRLFRTATEDMTLNGARIRRGDVLLLRITAANYDPERFACPHLLNVARRDAGHLTFGSGLHTCVGASLIRMAAQVITQPLLARFSSARIMRPPEWQGGATFQSPTALWVRLIEDAQPSAEASG
jgi:cytochrome P450